MPPKGLNKNKFKCICDNNQMLFQPYFSVGLLLTFISCCHFTEVNNQQSLFNNAWPLMLVSMQRDGKDVYQVSNCDRINPQTYPQLTFEFVCTAAALPQRENSQRQKAEWQQCSSDWAACCCRLDGGGSVTL